MIKKEKQYKLLSYPLSVDTHGYGGEKSLRIKKDRLISRGDSCNTSTLVFSNHLGTHIDCPKHFYNAGNSVCDYNIERLIFSNPIVLNCPKVKNQFITEDDIKKNIKYLRLKDAVLFKTGFYRFRGTKKYNIQNPGISPEAAEFIRKYCNSIKCIGIDAISVSSYSNRGQGRLTHSIFLNNNYKSQPMILVEDMNLRGNLDNLNKLYVVPLFVKGIDSSPCTVIGVLGKDNNGA